MTSPCLRPLGLLTLAMLSACASQPIGPTVQVMPANGKPFEQFAQEEGYCKSYAQGQIAGAVDQANKGAFGAAVLTTGLGAALGGALGGGNGAGIGAATGATAGAGVAADSSGAAQVAIQQRYDVAYSQCMYAKGDQVPGFQPPPPDLAPVAEAPPPQAPQAYAPPPPRFDPELVAAIQRELGRIGLLAGSPDGNYGSRTRGAIVDYQRTRNMPADGLPSADLLADLQKS